MYLINNPALMICEDLNSRQTSPFHPPSLFTRSTSLIRTLISAPTSLFPSEYYRAVQDFITEKGNLIMFGNDRIIKRKICRKGGVNGEVCRLMWPNYEWAGVQSIDCLLFNQPPCSFMLPIKVPNWWHVSITQEGGRSRSLINCYLLSEEGKRNSLQRRVDVSSR